MGDLAQISDAVLINPVIFLKNKYMASLSHDWRKCSLRRSLRQELRSACACSNQACSNPFPRLEINIAQYRPEFLSGNIKAPVFLDQVSSKKIGKFFRLGRHFIAAEYWATVKRSLVPRVLFGNEADEKEEVSVTSHPV